MLWTCTRRLLSGGTPQLSPAQKQASLFRGFEASDAAYSESTKLGFPRVPYWSWSLSFGKLTSMMRSFPRWNRTHGPFSRGTRALVDVPFLATSCGHRERISHLRSPNQSARRLSAGECSLCRGAPRSSSAARGNFGPPEGRQVPRWILPRVRNGGGGGGAGGEERRICTLVGSFAHEWTADAHERFLGVYAQRSGAFRANGVLFCQVEKKSRRE